MMSTELAVAGWLTLIQIALVMVQGAQVPRAQGLKWGLGSRDEPQPKTVFQSRVDRTVANHAQAMLMAVPLLLIVHLADASNGWTAFAAWLFLAGRILFAPLYLAGVAVWRSAAFALTLVALAILIVRIAPLLIAV